MLPHFYGLMERLTSGLLLGVIILGFVSCKDEEESLYTQNEITYNLHRAAESYDYEGSAVFRELKTGALELTITMTGNKGNDAYFFPAHLHYGPYDSPDAPMAAMLDPVDIRTLKSTTVIEKLEDGTDFTFDQLKQFDGHIKVHLAADGPDYNVILVAGNIGKNIEMGSFDLNKVAVCAPY